jgi:inosine-uridine nucleoside N-ribohydrolase
VKHLEKGRWTDLLAPYHVAGSGMDIAMGALMMGATAIQAVAAAIEPDLLETHGALVDVETSDGPAQGMTVTYRNDILREFLTGRGPNAAVAVDVDNTRFAQHFDARVADCL